jgi:hypothetical protein
MKLQALGYALIALALSLAGNAFLGWQWAESSVECKAKQLAAANSALREEWKRLEGADRRALEIARRIGAETADAARDAQQGTNQREDDYRRVPVTGECRMPVGLPDLRPAVEAARAAAGD